VELLPAVASDMETVHMVAFMMRLAGLKIRVITEAAIHAFNDKGLVYRDKDGREQSLEGTKIVLALGSTASRALADELRGKVPELYCVGDCNQPAKITEAIYEGSRIGRLI
jgi:NADH dehydrogenase FAD-containing subunit